MKTSSLYLPIGALALLAFTVFACAHEQTATQPTATPPAATPTPEEDAAQKGAKA